MATSSITDNIVLKDAKSIEIFINTILDGPKVSKDDIDIDVEMVTGEENVRRLYEEWKAGLNQ